MSDLLKGKCAAPKDPRPGITTYFCVFRAGHDGPHSWALTAEARREQLETEKRSAS